MIDRIKAALEADDDTEEREPTLAEVGCIDAYCRIHGIDPSEIDLDDLPP